MNVPIIDRQTALLKKVVKRIGVAEYIEFGCGEGHNLQTLSEMGLSGTGVDFSQKALDIARKKNISNTRLLEKNFMTDDIECKPADLTVMLCVLEHIDDDDKALILINSCVKKGGYFVLSVPAHEKSYSCQDMLVGHYRRYNRNTIIKKLESHKFYIEKMFCFGFPVANIYTALYNTYLLKILKIRPTTIDSQRTEISGIRSERSYFPKIIGALSILIFPVLSQIIKIDTLFLNYDLGTHYFILARKKGDFYDENDY